MSEHPHSPARVAAFANWPKFFLGLGTIVGAGVVALAVVLAIAGCATPARTDAAGPAAGATHETRDERPGVTRERTFELRLRPDGLEPRERDDERGAGVPSARAPVVPLRFALLACTIGVPQPEDSPDIPHGIPDAVRAAIETARAEGFEVELTVRDYEHVPLSATETRSEFAETPARLRTSSDDAALGFTTRLRRFPLPWGGEARGGGFGFEAELLGGEGVNALHLIGAGVMAIAVVPLLRTPRNWRAAGAFVLVGLGVVLTGTLVDRYPWVSLLAALGLVGLLGYGAYEAWRRGRSNLALDAITPAVERSSAAEEVKQGVADRAGRSIEAVRAEVRASKVRARV